VRIAFITTMKWGLTQFNFRDIDALTRKGHEVRLFVLRHTKGLYNPLPGWDVIPVSWPYLICAQLWFLIRRPVTYVRLLATALRTRSVIDLCVAVSFVDQMRDMDVAYVSWGDHKLFAGYYCKRIINIPLVVCIHAYELYKNPNPRMFEEALAYCDRIITVSEYNKDFLINRLSVPASRIDVVRHIIDLECYRYESKIKILIVGFFAEKKGHDVLFRALKMLNRGDVELWVVGDATPDIEPVDCRRLAEELGIESQVAFFGAQSGSALRALYRECDLFCAPSRTARDGDKEGLPTVIAEAMAFSKPVVATRHAGIPEAIDAVLVDENNVEQLADALNAVCNSSELRRRLGDSNRRAAERLFSLANNDRLEEILSRCSKHHSPGRQSDATIVGDPAG